MKNFVKFTVLVVLAVSATVASAADLEFHGYSRVNLGYNIGGGNAVSFMLSESGNSKLRLGNEQDWCLEPSFQMSFTKLDDKSAWGIHMLPAVYRRNNSPGDTFHNQADANLPVSYKEYYFYGQNVPQLGGGEIWAGRRYHGRHYLGAINDAFLEAQDGVGAGVINIPVGPAKLNFEVTAPQALNDGTAVNDVDMNPAVYVTGIPTINKDSALDLWFRAYVPMQKTNDPGKVPDAQQRQIGYDFSAIATWGFGSAGNLKTAATFSQNAYFNAGQTDNGGGVQILRGVLVYGVNIASARTSIDAVLDVEQKTPVKQFKDQNLTSAQKVKTLVATAGVRSDTQISGPFRFLLELGYDYAKTEKASGEADSPANKSHTLLKVTPCFAVSGGNDPWSRPTFRLYVTYANWNKDAQASVTGAWKGAGADVLYGAAGTDGAKQSGTVAGIQAEGWW